MPVHIGERFLHDAEDGDLHLVGKPPEFGGKLEVHINPAALGESFHEPAQRRFQSGLVEQRRMEQVRHGAEFLRQLAHQTQSIREVSARALA